MVSIMALWLPILLSAVIVFIVSSIIHMMLPYHRTDFGKLPIEDEVMDVLRKAHVPPGDYMAPYAGSMEAMKKPEFIAKRTQGPLIIMTLMKGAAPNMSGNLIQWFLYSLLIGFLTAYVTGHALGPGASYLSVFRFAGCTAFIAYAIGGWQSSIWYGRSWSTTLKNTFDGLVYGLMTAGTFGWLWPQ